MSFWLYLIGSIVRPRSTFEKLLSDPRQVALGFWSVMLIGFLYTLTTFGYVVAGAKPLMPPFLNIPADDYYAREIFFEIPVYIVGWLLAAGIVQLMSKAFQGKGSFDGTLSVLGFALIIPWYITWFFDTVIALLYLLHQITPEFWAEKVLEPGFWQIVNYCYPLIALIWIFTLVSVAVSVGHRLSWWKTGLITVITVVTVQIMMFVFIR